MIIIAIHDRTLLHRPADIAAAEVFRQVDEANGCQTSGTGFLGFEKRGIQG
jgi:hypothetical protein